jgi:hypothetical protein
MARDIEVLCGKMILEWRVLRDFVNGLIERIASERYDVPCFSPATSEGRAILLRTEA